MTNKTTMPEPLAWMLACQTYAGDTAWNLSWTQSGAGTCHRLSGEEYEKPLITTTQAEAYANGRVREALEEALIEVMRCKTSGIIRNDTVDKCADAIRALIPKEPPCET